MVDTNEQVEVSESQIAAHWKEEGLIPPSPGFIAQANMADPNVFERFSEKELPGVFPRVCRFAHLGQVLAHHAGHLQPSVLEVVRRWKAERFLQLHR